MTDVDIGRRARVTIARELACPLSRLTDNAEFRRDLGADSLDLVTVPAALENEFGIRLTDEEVEFCQTVGTAIDLIRTKLENRRAGERRSDRAGGRRRFDQRPDFTSPRGEIFPGVGR